MKKVITFFMIGIFFILSVYLVSAATTFYSNPDIQVTLLSQDPDPVEPGQVVKVKFKVENDGIETQKNVVIKLKPKNPFSLYKGKAEQNIGKLPGASTGADAVVVEYFVKVDEQAVEGEAELELEVKTEGIYFEYSNDDFMIDIQTNDAVLEIVSVTSDPELIAPGDTAKMTVQVKNLADSLLKDIKFKLDLSDSTIPLAPYQSSSEKRISSLQTGYQNTLTFDLLANPEATAGLYKVHYNLSYNDEKDNSYLVQDVLAIKVGETPTLKPYIKKSSVLQAGKAGTLTLELANAGTTGVKFLELSILPSSDFQLVSTHNYFYIGDVDSDDTESEELKIYVKEGVKSLSLPIKLNYYDANNKNYQQQVNLKMNLYTIPQLKKFGIIQTSQVGMYLLIVVLLVIGIILYRKYKKNPQEFFKKARKLKEKLPFVKKKR